MDVAQLQAAAKLQIAEQAKSDLFFLVKHVLNSGERSAFITEHTHQELCNYTSAMLPNGTPKMPPIAPTVSKGGVVDNMSDQYDPSKNFLMLLMPRGTFKSSVVTIGFSLQLILNDPNARILIDSETFSKSKAFLAEIKGHLEHNQAYREIFKTIYGMYPNENRDDLWTGDELNISARRQPLKEPTFSCSGVGVTKTGMHYDLIIMDDLHSEKNVTTKEQIDTVKEHYKLALSLLDPGKPLIIIGTRWDYNDLYQHILDSERGRFNIIIRKAYNPDGSLFFPERLTEKFLSETKESQGSYVFSCQYYNEPVDNETATFKRSQMVRKPWELVKDRPMNWYLLVDPSYEGPYSDYAALIIAGMDYMGDIYVRHILRQKMTYSDIINAMFDLYQRFQPKKIVLETIATQKSIQYELNNEQKSRGLHLPIIEIKKQVKSKEERIRGLAPKYEFGHIYHISDCPQLDDLEYELIHFPKAKHDDVVDCLANILDVAVRPTSEGHGEERQRRRKKFAAWDKPRSPVTGV